MSVDLIVYLARSAMPSPQRWQQAIRDAGFPVELDTDFDVYSSIGFRPCQFRGGEAGFEYFSATIDESERDGLGAPAGCDFSVTLVTHSDLRDFASSLLAAGALGHASGGLLVDPQAGESYPPERALDWARAQLAELEPELARSTPRGGEPRLPQRIPWYDRLFGGRGR